MMIANIKEELDLKYWISKLETGATVVNNFD
jgi:hypothetical protein